jgi:hypothetical protein
MPAAFSRRAFLGDVGKGMLVATVGPALAVDLGLAAAAEARGEGGKETIDFGSLEKLVEQLQETPIARLNALLVEKLKSGTDLKTLTSAAALANARTFGGEDYVGFHTMMALPPAYQMSRELPDNLAPLPVMKVLYRNTNRIQEKGGRKSEVLHPVAPPDGESLNYASGEALRTAVRSREMDKAEQVFAGLAGRGADEAFNALLYAVHDHTEVHRVVLPYRAWEMLDLVGKEQAHTLLRQSVRYCVKAESWGGASYNEPKALLPKLMEQYKLLEKKPGDKPADDAFVEQLSETIFGARAEIAAEAAAKALADGYAPDVVGEAISLAANQLILRDNGRPPNMEVPGKPIGSVHGDSIGVHACDSANAWRNMARVANARNTFACLILGAYQVALDRVDRGGDFLHWQPLPLKMHLDSVRSEDAKTLLGEAEDAIKGNLQARATAIATRYGHKGHDPRAMFDLMLKYAVSEDGSLHAEKFYRTASQEFGTTRPAFRWRQMAALARVTASEYGRPAAGMAEAREMLKV